MQEAAQFRGTVAVPTDQDPRLSHLKHLIERAAHLLPAQGPITVFIHHNTLHAFEHLPFHEAVERGAQIFGCQPYLTEDQYRAALQRGRIRFDELRAVLEHELGWLARERVADFATRLDLRLAMLQYAIPAGPADELLWFVAETDALRRVRDGVSAPDRARLIAETRHWVMRDLRVGYGAGHGATPSPASSGGLPAGLGELFARFHDESIENWTDDDWESFALQALWRICLHGVRDLPPFGAPAPAPGRHRELLLKATGADADRPVNELLIRFCAAFLDQGQARWPLPHRDEGFLRAFASLYGAGVAPEPWRRGLRDELARLGREAGGPLASILASLQELGVAEHEWESFLSETLLALPGWAGMLQQIETRGDRVLRPVPAGSLIEFLAVRLVLDRLSLAHAAREALGYSGPLDALRKELRRRLPSKEPIPEQRAFAVFQLAQLLGVASPELHRLTRDAWADLVAEIEVFGALERRRVFHLAYERRFNTQALDAVALHARRPALTPARPRFQASFCIDEREESLRRHIEEMAPDAETLSTAGFYSTAMYYRGAADAHYVPLCPVVVRPQHWVAEQVVESLAETHQRRARTRRVLGMARHHFHVGSRSFALGALLSTAVGVLASIPLVATTLFPRLIARIRRHFGRFVQAPPMTRLRLERTEPTAGPDNGHVGFTLDEMTAIAEKVLRDVGLTRNFAPLVFTFGHGSTSMNNPHESAYDCGACGGACGGPNGRAIAQMLNDPRIRARLAARGIAIPDGTAFVGGMHNTSTEAVTFYDIDRIPSSHRAALEEARALFEAAGDRNAHERARRFQSAPLTLSYTGARRHVEGRAEDLAQARPELGHATNAFTIIGRRRRTRGLFLDRRAFLNSYDPTQDDADATVLARTLAAVFPVCAGISLEYYFSRVDNSGLGSGTKLPHNITSFLGVMDGTASDLRTGLPWQMVEIHEPMRHLFIIETTPEIMSRLMDQNPGIGRLVRNEWVYLALLDPDEPRIRVYRDGTFHEYQPQADRLPRAPSSVAWYRGWRDHLAFASIESGATGPTGEAEVRNRQSAGAEG